MYAFVLGSLGSAKMVSVGPCSINSPKYSLSGIILITSSIALIIIGSSNIAEQSGKHERRFIRRYRHHSKPSPQPFQLAIEKLACAVEEIVYVGDREEAEIQAAGRFGLKTIQVNRSGAVQNVSADIVIRSVSEVPKVVRFARS